MVSPRSRVPKFPCEGLYYVVCGIFLGSFIIYIAKSQGAFDLSSGSSSMVLKCNRPTIRGGDDNRAKSIIPTHRDPNDDSFNATFPAIKTCLDPDGPKPVILMSLGRSGTDSTWDVLKKLTGTKMKAIEIVGGWEDQTVDFFRSLEGLATEADFWSMDETYDWRKMGGGTQSAKGFYFHIKEFCANGNCLDGKWIFKWFCEEQQRYKDIGGLVGFKWKGYMSAFRTKPAYNALKTIAALSGSNTPIRVIRSRRNPVDVYLSELKHSLQEDLPDHCRENNEECLKQHASIRLVVPVEEMYEWLYKTYNEENEIDALLSELGVPTVHVEYDQLYYARSVEEAVKEWNKMFRFLGQRDDWTWGDIADAEAFNPTTKSRSHKVLIENFDAVYARLKGTKLEQFVRIE